MFSPAMAGGEQAKYSSSACSISGSDKIGGKLLLFFFIVRKVRGKQNPNQILNPSKSFTELLIRHW